MIDKFINKIHQGNSLDILKQMPDSSVDCVITSPPYWQLRDYGYSDQWGLEPTYQEYLEHLWSLMDEIYRILKPTGTAWINLGDVYSGSGGSGSKEYYPKHTQFGKSDCKEGKYQPPTPKIEIPNKCLLLIPHRFAIGLQDGINGHKQWILRNDVIWAKRNCMPESVTDRFSKKHEYFFFMVKEQKYYFDLDGIKDRTITKDNSIRNRDITKLNNTPGRGKMGGLKENNYDSKNPGDVSDFWDINTMGSSEKHYASYNFKLIEKPIIAGCPEFVCKKCGKPREKIIENIDNRHWTERQKPTKKGMELNETGQRRDLGGSFQTAKKEFKGLTDCGCEAGFEGGICLDPFVGTGTTLVRALQLGRRVIGIDGSKEYCKIAREKISVELNQLKLAY